MKIAILTSGILPVPAVQGGAVENLVDFYLEYNNKHHLHDITIFSVDYPAARKHHALQSDVNHYHFVDTSSLTARIKRKIRGWIRPRGDYYNNYIEFFFEQAYKTLRRSNYDCIILENRPGYAKKLSERGWNNLVLHLHNDLLNNSTPYHQQLFNSLNRIITVSDYIKNRVSTIQYSDKIQTVHNGINLDNFSPNINTTINRKDIGFKTDDFVLVFSGRINKDKGIAELVEAMLLLHEYPNIKLLIIGSPFFGNAADEDDFVHNLKANAKSIEDRLVFTGFIPYNQMPNYLRLADVAIIPSIWDEPFGLTVLEAMASGRPLITTQGGGIPEICEGAAILIERENIVQHLADSIIFLYNNPEYAKEIGKKAVERSWKFDKEIFSKTYFEAVDKIMGGQH